MEGRNGNLIESGAYWLLYVVSVSGVLLHWRLGNELLSGVCVMTAVLGALMIGSRKQNLAAHR